MSADGIRVLKFGGSSVEDPVVMRRAAMVTTAALSRDGRPGSGPGVVVVSALGGVTRELLRLAAAAIEGNSEIATECAETLHERHSAFLQKLDLGHADVVAMQQLIDDLFSELKRQLKACPRSNVSAHERSAFEDSILAFGELLASRLFWSVLQSLGVQCVWMDARSFVRTDDRFRAAQPNLKRTRELTQEIVRPALDQDQSVIVPGFIGSTAHGRSTTMGFEASDLTASLLASALDAREVQIWTDVSGVMTADPRIVSEAHPIPHLHYDAARELAFLGARVLHPATMQPARLSGIGVRVVNCSRPGDAGTVIDGETPHGVDPEVLAVASRSGQRVLAVAVRDDYAGPIVGLLRDLAARRSIVDPLFATWPAEPGTVEVVVAAKPSSQFARLERAAAQFGAVSVSDHWSAVSIVSCGGRSPEWPLAHHNVLDWDGRVGSRGTLVPDRDCAATVLALHTACMARPDASSRASR